MDRALQQAGAEALLLAVRRAAARLAPEDDDAVVLDRGADGELPVRPGQAAIFDRVGRQFVKGQRQRGDRARADRRLQRLYGVTTRK